MAKILSKEVCDKIKKIRKEFEPYAEKGWMCEGGETSSGEPCNAIFNNDTDGFVLADYNGGIIQCQNCDMEDAVKMADIQARITTLTNC